jgi:hypothetical protein
MGIDYSFWIIETDVLLRFDEGGGTHKLSTDLSIARTCLGVNGIGVRHWDCWMNNGCAREMSLLCPQVSCMVGLFKPAEIGWLCDTSCVGCSVDGPTGRRWLSTNLPVNLEVPEYQLTIQYMAGLYASKSLFRTKKENGTAFLVCHA